MGSGNKLKRKQKKASPDGVSTSSGKSGSTGLQNLKELGKKLGRDTAPGVVFDIEPDADELFRASMRQLDQNLLDQVRDEDFPPDATKSRAESRAPRVIDLHGMTVEEASWRVEAELDEAVATNRGEISFKIITGKGLHSGPTGAVLPREMHRFILERYGRRIVAIESSPDEVKVGGVPLRGHFEVKLRAGKI